MSPPTLMNLKVLLPFQIFAEKTGVSRIAAETREGSFGLLPHRLDCVAALAPGIRYPGSRSWTLALLLAGLAIGCLNAWHWVAKEDKAMRDEGEDDHE